MIAPAHPEVLEGARVAGMVVWQDRLVAAGKVVDVGGTTDRSAIWTTRDGAAWTAVDPRPEQPTDELVGLGVRGSSLVVLWSELRETAGPDDYVLTVAVTRDLRTWERHEVARGRFFFGDGYLAVTDRVAVVATMDLSPGDTEQQVRIWRSDELDAWEPIEGENDTFRDVVLGTVGVVGRQVFVAAPVVANGTLATGALWASTDGRSWRRTDLEERASFGQVTGRDGHVLVVGGRLEGRAVEMDVAAWTLDGTAPPQPVGRPGDSAASGNQFAKFGFLDDDGSFEIVGNDSQTRGLAIWSWSKAGGWTALRVPGVDWQATTVWDGQPIALAARDRGLALWRAT